jgi:hypothetical protein
MPRQLGDIAAIGAPRCCGFLATPANISRFDVATGLTHLGSEVDHDWALAGGLVMGVHSLSHYLPEAVWGQPELCAAITAAKNLASAFIAIGTCTFVLRRA